MQLGLTCRRHHNRRDDLQLQLQHKLKVSATCMKGHRLCSFATATTVRNKCDSCLRMCMRLPPPSCTAFAASKSASCGQVLQWLRNYASTSEHAAVRAAGLRAADMGQHWVVDGTDLYESSVRLFQAVLPGQKPAALYKIIMAWRRAVDGKPANSPLALLLPCLSLPRPPLTSCCA